MHIGKALLSIVTIGVYIGPLTSHIDDRAQPTLMQTQLTTQTKDRLPNESSATPEQSPIRRTFLFLINEDTRPTTVLVESGPFKETYTLKRSGGTIRLSVSPDAHITVRGKGVGEKSALAHMLAPRAHISTFYLETPQRTRHLQIIPEQALNNLCTPIQLPESSQR